MITIWSLLPWHQSGTDTYPGYTRYWHLSEHCIVSSESVSTLNRGKDCGKETLQKESKTKAVTLGCLECQRKHHSSLISLLGQIMIVKTKSDFLLWGLSVFTVTTIYGDIRCLLSFWWSSLPHKKVASALFAFANLITPSDLAGTTSVMTTNIRTLFRVIEVSAYQVLAMSVLLNFKVSLYLVACMDSDSALIPISFQRQTETRAQAGTWRPGWARCWASCGSPAPRRSSSGP